MDLTVSQPLRCPRLPLCATRGATDLAKGVILKKGKKYGRDLPKLLYSSFLAMVNDGVPPSFSKFARSVGMTVLELETLRGKHPQLDRAWRECIEIRRDYLIDTALTRRYDPSFVKFLLTEEGAAESCAEEINVSVTVTDG